jgi:methyl-accepting chemotaxis protein
MSIKENLNSKSFSMNMDFMRRVSVGLRMHILTAIVALGFAACALVIVVGMQARNEAEVVYIDHVKLAELSRDANIDGLQMRRSEKDFMIRKLEKYLGKNQKASGKMAAALEEAKALEIHEADAEIASLSGLLPKYVAQFQAIFDAQQSLGFDEKQGLQGKLRKSVHAVEVELKKFKQDNLTVSMLMMRRHEKDFIMRKAEKYVGRMAKRKAEFNAMLAATDIDPAAKKHLIQSMETYHNDFNAFAAVDIKMASEVKKLSGIYAEMEPHLNKLFEIAETGLVESAHVQKAAQTNVVTNVGIIALIVFLIVAVSFWVVGRSIRRPIEGLNGAMLELASGNLKVSIDGVQARDEVGEMARSVEVFQKSAVEAKRLEEEAGQNRAEREQRAEEDRKRDAAENAERAKRQETMDGLTGGFSETVESILGMVASQATQMESTARSMSGVAETTRNQSDTVSTAAEQATASVQTVASAAEELTASVDEISRQVTHSAQISGEAVSAAEGTNQTIRELADAAQRIGEVVDLINDIANQTNLLALNATIEAARAGEAGKGFAVVASEVKNLASQTAQATEDIGQQIGAIQSTTKEAVTAIEGIGSTIGEMNEIATAIASAVEEQGAATSEISRNVQEAAEGTREVSENISEVRTGSEKTETSSNEVLTASRDLSEKFGGLKTEVESFLAGIKAA